MAQLFGRKKLRFCWHSCFTFCSVNNGCPFWGSRPFLLISKNQIHWIFDQLQTKTIENFLAAVQWNLPLVGFLLIYFSGESRYPSNTLSISSEFKIRISSVDFVHIWVILSPQPQTPFWLRQFTPVTQWNDFTWVLIICLRIS